MYNNPSRATQQHATQPGSILVLKKNADSVALAFYTERRSFKPPCVRVPRKGASQNKPRRQFTKQGKSSTKSPKNPPISPPLGSIAAARYKGNAPVHSIPFVPQEVRTPKDPFFAEVVRWVRDFSDTSIVRLVEVAVGLAPEAGDVVPNLK